MSSKGSRTVRRTTRSVLIFTTAGKTFATAKTAGSEAGSASAFAKHGAEAATVKNAANVQTARFFRGIRAASNEAAFGLSTCRTVSHSCHVEWSETSLDDCFSDFCELN